MEKIRLGISRCLLGENVRYDGGNRLDHYLKYTLGKYIDWISVCPEVDCGLSVPREAMRLVGQPNNPRLVTIKTGIDYTEKMLSWSKKILPWLKKQDICGFVFKSGSPSSGLRNVRVYNKDGVPSRTGVGIFAAEFIKYFPEIPVEEDGRLYNVEIRENFLTRVFTYYRWKKFLKEDGSLGGLVDFHTKNKYLIMSHSQNALLQLGRLVAHSKEYKKDILFEKYFDLMMKGLKNLSSVKNNVNVLQHIMGYFKKDLSIEEKQELLELIDNYKKQYLPLIVPKTLLLHYVKKYNKEYLKQQYYLSPLPLELMAINRL